MFTSRRIVAATVTAGFLVSLSAALPAEAKAKPKMPAEYKNCTVFNKKYPHGVGKKGAKDHVKGKSKPVTTFRVDTKIYNAAMTWNKDLDRDKDGIACEKR